jgi:hypothetical protein
VTELYLLELTLTGHVEQRSGGLWASYNYEFGFVTYGKTAREAIRGATTALDMSIEAFRGDIKALEKWLRRKNIGYKLTKLRRRPAPTHIRPKVASYGSIEKYELPTRRSLAAAA